MPEDADLIENTEMDLARFIEDRHKAGLSYHDLIRILALQLENVLLQFEAELQLESKTHQNQNLRP